MLPTSCTKALCDYSHTAILVSYNGDTLLYHDCRGKALHGYKTCMLLSRRKRDERNATKCVGK